MLSECGNVCARWPIDNTNNYLLILCHSHFTSINTHSSYSVMILIYDNTVYSSEIWTYNDTPLPFLEGLVTWILVYSGISYKSTLSLCNQVSLKPIIVNLLSISDKKSHSLPRFYYHRTSSPEAGVFAFFPCIGREVLLFSVWDLQRWRQSAVCREGASWLSYMLFLIHGLYIGWLLVGNAVYLWWMFSVSLLSVRGSKQGRRSGFKSGGTGDQFIYILIYIHTCMYFYV